MGISIFEIIGPVMIGPSSSHTAGMARIGMMAHRIAGETPLRIDLWLNQTLKNTYAGHRTDAALIGGAMGIGESDPKIRDARELAAQAGISTSVNFLDAESCHQNTARLYLTLHNGKKITISGISVGGGSVVLDAIDEVPLRISPEAFQLLVWSRGGAPLADVCTEGLLQSGQRGGVTLSCRTLHKLPDSGIVEALRAEKEAFRVCALQPVLEYGVTLPTEKRYTSCEEVEAEARARHCSVAEIAVQYEMARSGFSKESVRERMALQLERMKSSRQEGASKEHKLRLTEGNDGKKLLRAIAEGKTISGGIVPIAIAHALGIMEYNGSMGCIVAAPTAGSSGIVPGCLLTVQEQWHFSDEKIIDALFVAGLLGVVMAERKVSFSGAVGGCQGEVGVSSAIAAAGLASLFTADTTQIMHACALCLKNLLGLICDPIAGPVEVPCIKRNAVGVANAFASVDMALAGIKSFLPPDEVIDALVDVEKRLPQELKGSTVGGLACTKTAEQVRCALTLEAQEREKTHNEFT